MPLHVVSPAEAAPQDTLTRDAANFHRALQNFTRQYEHRGSAWIGSYGLNKSEAHALEILVFHDAIALHQLAAELFVDNSTASRIVDRLVKKGYVNRVTDPEDRRAVQLEVTPAGHEVHEAIRNNTLQDLADLLRGFSPQTRRWIIKRIGHMTDALADLSSTLRGVPVPARARTPRLPRAR